MNGPAPNMFAPWSFRYFVGGTNEVTQYRLSVESSAAEFYIVVSYYYFFYLCKMFVFTFCNVVVRNQYIEGIS